MTYRAAELEQAFAEHLRAVSEALAHVGAEYMLIGGLAVGVWVEPRATKDAELSVRVLAPVNALKGALADAGLEVVRGDLTRAVERGEVVRLRRRAPSGTPIVIDLLFATTPFEIDALARRRPLHVLGVDVPVTTPEDLFIFKLIAGRPQDLAARAERRRARCHRPLLTDECRYTPAALRTGTRRSVPNTPYPLCTMARAIAKASVLSMNLLGPPVP